MKNKVVLFLSLFITIFFLSGCWSKKELTDIAIVSALGIDIDDDGKYVGTFQITIPANVAGGLQGGSSGESPTVTVYSAKGESIVELSRRASSKVSRELYYSHANLVVIGEELAKNVGLNRILDALDRDIQFRNTTTVAIAKESKAADILKVTVPINKIPSDKIIKTIKTSEENWGGNISVDIREVIEAITTAGKEPVIPAVTLKGESDKSGSMDNIKTIAPAVTIETDGIGIFKDDKLIGWLSDELVVGTVWVLDKIKQTTVAVDWKEEHNAINFQVIRAQTKVKPKIKDDIPIITIDIFAKGDIGEVNAPVNIDSLETQRKIEDKIEKKIKLLVHEAVKEAQANQADILGFGDKIYRNDPKSWDKLKHEWNNHLFAEAKVVVNAEAIIVRSGLRKSPFILEMEKNEDKDVKEGKG